MSIQLQNEQRVTGRHVLTQSIELPDGATTTIHVARYLRGAVVPRVVTFNEPTYLADWCQENGVLEASSGGFFFRANDRTLGEVWINGQQQNTEPFSTPWDKLRGALHVGANALLSIGPRHELPERPDGDLLQAGPLLVRNGQPAVAGRDTEGFWRGAHQFDQDDLVVARHPRAAIGYNSQYIWNVAVDGRSPKDAGVTLEELATYMVGLGVSHALNLDGGGSVTLISDGRMRNTSRDDNKASEEEALNPNGRPVRSAIIFEATRG